MAATRTQSDLVKTSIIIATLLVGHAVGADVFARECGEVEVKVLRQVIPSNKSEQRFVEIELANGFCRPIGIAPFVSPSGKYWFAQDKFVRWESRRSRSSQWVAIIGYESRQRPGAEPLVMLQPGDKKVVYVELQTGFSRDFKPGPYRRVFITDASGVSRSSREFTLEEFPAVADIAIDVGAGRAE